MLAATTLTLVTLASTWIVDSGGGGTHLEIEPAISGASDGDVILVRSGTYNSFVIGNKTLSILADDGATVNTGTIRVRNLDESKHVVLSGLDAKGVPGSIPSTSAGFYGLNNEGSIRLSDCTMTGGPFSFPGTNDWSGAIVDQCADVSFEECILTGRQQPGSLATAAGTPKVGHGLLANDSGISVYDSELYGGNGAEAFGYVSAIAGGSGARLTNCDFFAAGTSFKGGYGGDGDVEGGGEEGGSGLTSVNSSANILDCTSVGGYGGCHFGWVGCKYISPDGLPYVGDPTILPGRSVEIYTPLMVNTSSQFPIRVEGAEGTRVFLLASSSPDRTASAQARGVLQLSQPLYGFYTSM